MTPEHKILSKGALAALVALLRDGCNLRQRDGEHAAEAIEHLQAEVARLSTPTDDAEVAGLVDGLTLHTKDPDCIKPSPIMCSAADALTRLSHALAAETAKREAMEEALTPFALIADLVDEETEGVSDTDEFGLFFLNGEDNEPVWLAERFSVQKFQEVRATLAKHGSK